MLSPAVSAARLVLADSVTAVPGDVRDAVLVSGSHGGRYAAACALRLGVAGVIFNDAGKGRDEAGVAGLGLLEEHGVAGACVAHSSARIGDAADGLERGVLSAVNAPAKAQGLRAGMDTRTACNLLRGCRGRRVDVPMAEARRLRHAAGGTAVHVLDSNSLVEVGDAGAIVVTGSHGGLLGGRPESAIKHDVFAAFYNDAGVGVDDAGIGRLATLERRGIAGIAVHAWSARIGEGLSTYEDGIVSVANARARALGVRDGMTARHAVECLARARHEYRQPGDTR